MSQLLFDANGNLRDHGTFVPDDGWGDASGASSSYSADTASAQDIGRMIGLIVGVAFVITEVIVSSPPVQRWWSDRVKPTIKRWFSRRAQPTSAARRGAPLAIGASELSVPESTPEEFAREVDDAVAAVGERMTSEEAQRRLAALLAAAAFIADQMRALSEARIVDKDALPTLRLALEQLSTEQVTHAMNRMLESNTDLLDERTGGAFLDVFGGGVTVEGVYVPLESGRIRDALRLPELSDTSPERESDDSHTDG
jgi:hypothetical protein